jgi:hypothetical protein
MKPSCAPRRRKNSFPPGVVGSTVVRSRKPRDGPANVPGLVLLDTDVLGLLALSRGRRAGTA